MNKHISFDALTNCIYTFKGKDEIIDISNGGDIDELARLINETDEDIPLFILHPSDLGAIGVYRLISPYQTLSGIGKIKLIVMTAFYKPSRRLVELRDLYEKTRNQNQPPDKKIYYDKLKAVNGLMTEESKKLGYFIDELLNRNTAVSGALFNRVYDRHVLDFMKYVKSKKIKIILDNDDLIQNLPHFNIIRHHIDKENRKINYVEALRTADKLTVSTQFLRENISAITGREVFVYPNMVKLEDINGANVTSFNNIMKYVKDGAPDKRMRILYAGSNTHTGDFDKYRWLFEEIADDWRFKLVFKGYAPQFLLNRENVETHPWETFDIGAYYASLAGLNCQLGIIPLVEHEFNRAKSNIKLIEMSGLGIPSICSDFDRSPYSDAPMKFNFRDRKNVIKTLHRLYGEPDFYLSQVKNAFKYFEDYCLEKHLYRLNNLLDYISG